MAIKLILKNNKINSTPSLSESILQEALNPVLEQETTERKDEIGGTGAFGSLPREEKIRILQKGISMIKDIQQKLKSSGIQAKVYGDTTNLQKYNKFIKQFHDIYNKENGKKSVEDIIAQIKSSIEDKLNLSPEDEKYAQQVKIRQLSPAREAFNIRLADAFKNVGIKFNATQRNIIWKLLSTLIKSGAGLSLSEATAPKDPVGSNIKKAIDGLVKMKEFSDIVAFNKKGLTDGLAAFFNQYRTQKPSESVPQQTQTGVAQPKQTPAQATTAATQSSTPTDTKELKNKLTKFFNSAAFKEGSQKLGLYLDRPITPEEAKVLNVDPEKAQASESGDAYEIDQNMLDQVIKMFPDQQYAAYDSRPYAMPSKEFILHHGKEAGEAPQDINSELQKKLLASKISDEVSAAVASGIASEINKLLSPQQVVQEAYEKEFSKAKEAAANIIKKVNEQENLAELEKTAIYRSIVDLSVLKQKTPELQFFVSLLNKEIASIERNVRFTREEYAVKYGLKDADKTKTIGSKQLVSPMGGTGIGPKRGKVAEEKEALYEGLFDKFTQKTRETQENPLFKFDGKKFILNN